MSRTFSHDLTLPQARQICATSTTKADAAQSLEFGAEEVGSGVCGPHFESRLAGVGSLKPSAGLEEPLTLRSRKPGFGGFVVFGTF